MTGAGADWWRSAVVYQVYLRSFADADGDGAGDIAGLRSRLPYLADLGVDAIWINPWYPSPLADGGYDIVDYRDVHPEAGTMADADGFISDAHALGIRVLLDIVPNHTSDQHPWFQQALASGVGSTARDRYLFRPGRGPGGDQPPNNWMSQFGGPAWTRVTEPDGQPGQWYLHLFAAQQPDLAWSCPEVRADFEDTLRFWFDRGVDGFRIDVANSLTKDVDLPDLDALELSHRTGPDREHPHWDRPDVHDIYRGWRKVADSYDPPRVFVAEAWVDTPERMAQYVRPDELHNAFNFEFLSSRWHAKSLRLVIDGNLAAQQAVGAPATWVLSNHDVARHPSRYARPQGEERGHNFDHLIGVPADHERGLQRARAAILLMLALPGSVYLYQGEELGLLEVEDLADEVLTDPTWERSGRTLRGRDGCRVPIPWSGDAPPFGFSPDGSAPPWLPQPAAWADRTVHAQAADPDSTLNLYRRALRQRADHPALGDGTMQWCDTPEDVLMFARSPRFVCAVNFADTPLQLPPDAQITLTSGPLTGDGTLPQDTAVWLQTDR